MKLYYAPDTCSLSPHTVLRELQLEFELVRVNNRSKITADGRDFRAINPKGYVAALELDDGQILTEGPAIVQYLADLKPEHEIHAGSAPLFNPALPEEVRAIFREKLFRQFDFLQATLNEKTYLTGPSFSVADAYLFAVLGWCKFFSISLERWPALLAYRETINARPAVQAALLAEASL